jgi:hypothetical protein
LPESWRSVSKTAVPPLAMFFTYTSCT